MDTYEWQKNFAIVNRLYYTERLWETTLFATGLYTWANIMFIRKGYFVNTMKQRVAPIWLKMLGMNTVVTFILIKPLQKEEDRNPRQQQPATASQSASPSELLPASQAATASQ